VALFKSFGLLNKSFEKTLLKKVLAFFILEVFGIDLPTLANCLDSNFMLCFIIFIVKVNDLRSALLTIV
jgi:hypothetical protein